MMVVFFFFVLLYAGTVSGDRVSRLVREPVEGMVLSGLRGKALYLYNKAQLQQFPDFYTFTAMGFNMSSIHRMRDEALLNIPRGAMLTRIQGPPPFRPDDWMYHNHCDDPPRLINDLSVIANVGNFHRYLAVHKRVSKSKKIVILALGGSITAGGYFLEFVRHLKEQEGLSVTVHNHGHGATELTYTIFCVDVDRYQPDLVLIDFSVNDYGHPKLMDALLRKSLSFPSKPLVVLVNLWVHAHCPVPRYLAHSQYYQVPLINVCPAVNLCYGRDRMPRYVFEQYSKTDGVHPWGVQGVPFLGRILYAWWQRFNDTVTGDEEVAGAHDQYLAINEKLAETAYILPKPLYVGKAIGACTRCDALAADADAVLAPDLPPKGFRIVTRVKVGYGGFNPNDTTSSTKSFKRSWQADTPGSTISFRFYGSTVKVAMWQRRDGMGIVEAVIDKNPQLSTRASGFFKGYTWNMAANNTGRSEIVTLFEGLEDKEHLITFTVTDQPANIWVKGHTVQIFALLSASNNKDCKNFVAKAPLQKTHSKS